MSLFDSALQKAYRRNEPQAKSSERRGPHFKPPRTNQNTDASTTRARELYVTDSRPVDEDAASRETAVGHTQPSELPPVISFDPPSASSSQTTTNRIDDAAVKAPRASSEWISLFRHEVSTNEPELYGWHLPSHETRARSLPRIAPTMDAGTEHAAGTVLDSPVDAPVDQDQSASQAKQDETVESVDIEAESEKFRAGWELDRFRVGEVCERVEEALADELSSASGQLIRACGDGRRVVTVGSWNRGEGRTTVAIVLARALAEAGCAVALVDGDFENPEMATALGLAAENGEISRDFSYEEVANSCVKSIEDRVTFFPCAALNVSPDDRMGTLDRAVEVLQQHFDVVIVDLPPGRSDACHTTAGLRVLVRNATQTPEETLSRWVSRVESLVDVPVKIIDNFTNR